MDALDEKIRELKIEIKMLEEGNNTISTLKKENEELKEKLHRSEAYLQCWKDNLCSTHIYGRILECFSCGGLEFQVSEFVGESNRGCKCCDRCQEIPAFCKCRCDKCTLYKYKDAGYLGTRINANGEYTDIHTELCKCEDT